MNQALPLFYFKSKICWVDDDRLFLDAISIAFADDYQTVSFSNPVSALNFFNNTYEPELKKINFVREFVDTDHYNTNHRFQTDIDINEISKLAERSAEINDISVLVVDYNMPNINGLELCRHLVNCPFKKILLTGETNYSEAVEAFNQGLIDKFIEKGPNVIDGLQNYIFDLSYQYFKDATANILTHLEASRISPLSDPQFGRFFNNWCIKHKIKEFYLVNKQGSFLVKDSKDCFSLFIVFDDYEKEEFIKLNDDAFDKIGDILKEVKEGRLIPFFGINKESWEYSFSEWKNYFYPAQIFKGRNNYYWSVISNYYL